MNKEYFEKVEHIAEALDRIDNALISEALDYKRGSGKGGITLSKKKIVSIIIAACAVLVIGAAMAAINIGNVFSTKPQDKDMTESIVVLPINFENYTSELKIEVLDPSVLPFGEDEVILAVFGEFDISDSDGNFIAHVDNMSLNEMPYDPNVQWSLNGITEGLKKDGYVATGETVTELCVLRTGQEDGSWQEEARIWFENVYYNTENGEYIALSYDYIVLESGTYNIHIDTLEIAYANGEQIIELTGDWTTTFTI